MPAASFWFGQYNYDSGLSYYESLASNLTQVQILFSLDYPGLGLPENMYSMYATMLQNITSSNFNCSLTNSIYPVGSNCISTNNTYNTQTL